MDAKLFAEAEVDIRESMDGSESTSVVLWDYIIELDDSFPQALEVARLAVEEWHELLLKYGLELAAAFIRGFAFPCKAAQPCGADS